MHLQPPCNTLPRQAHDIQETEALAKLAIELNAPLDITLQSTFERLVALAGSKEFLPVAAKVHHYLQSVSIKRREWCVEFCIKPYSGPMGEGLFGRIGREGMVCGGTYVVPAACLRGLDMDHHAYMERLKGQVDEATFMEIQFNQQQQMQNMYQAGLGGGSSGSSNPSHIPRPTPQQHVFNANPLPYPKVTGQVETRPCCSVDTTVFDLLGLSNSYLKHSEYAYDSTPSWLNPYYANHYYENSYLKSQKEAQILKNEREAAIRLQVQQQRAMQQQAQFEAFYQQGLPLPMLGQFPQSQMQQPQMGIFKQNMPSQQQHQMQQLIFQNQQQQQISMLNGQSMESMLGLQQLQIPQFANNNNTPNKRQKLDDPTQVLQHSSHNQQSQQQNQYLKQGATPTKMSNQEDGSIPPTTNLNNIGNTDGMSRASSSSGLNIANAARAAEN
ncbi:UNVERIFIED_CONTAM: hypothetical protein HDU68_002362 [Siphonaria sp. JEL0065]|nr:hypothetical protein HDU68_002362 [Siphonaria sp. JEL0065]